MSTEAYCCVDSSDNDSLIDRESFLAFGVALTMFTMGWVGIIGSDDILACFVVGNALTWDDWFRIRSEEDSFQEVIDQLLNSVRRLPSSAVTDLRRPSSSTSEQSCHGPSSATTGICSPGVSLFSAFSSCFCAAFLGFLVSYVRPRHSSASH